MIIREATFQDLNEIWNLTVELIKDAKKYYKKFKIDKKTIKEIRVSVKNTLHDKNSRYYVAIHGGKIIGYILGVIKKRSKNKPEFPDYIDALERKYGYASDIFVVKKFRKLGVGTRLMTALIDWFKRQNVKLVEGHIISKNKSAIKLVKKLGLKEFEKVMWKKIK